MRAIAKRRGTAGLATMLCVIASGGMACAQSTPRPPTPKQYEQGYAQLDASIAKIKAAYDARHAADPSQPTFEEAVQQAANNHAGELSDEAAAWANKSSSQTRIDGIKSSAQALHDNRENGSLVNSREAREKVVAGMLGGFTSVADASGYAPGLALGWLARVYDGLIIPGVDPSVHRQLAQVESVAEYNTNQSEQDVMVLERNAKRSVPEATDKMEKDGIFRRDNDTSDFMYQDGRNSITITKDYISTSWCCDADGEYIAKQQQWRDAQSPAGRQAIIDFARDHLGAGMDSAIQLELDRRARQREAGSNAKGLVDSDSDLQTEEEAAARAVIAAQSPQFEALIANLTDPGQRLLHGEISVSDFFKSYVGELVQSVAFDPIYAHTNLGQGTKVNVQVPSTQVAGPSKVVTQPSTQIAVPTTQVATGASAVLTTPDTHPATGASSVLTTPDKHPATGASSVMNTPDLYAPTGTSSVMTTPDLYPATGISSALSQAGTFTNDDPALCGR